jgi:hypothetical protein
MSPLLSLVKGMTECESIVGTGTGLPADCESVKCDNLDSDSNQNGILVTELKYTELAEHVKVIVHLEDHAAFTGRAAHPAA